MYYNYSRNPELLKINSPSDIMLLVMGLGVCPVTNPVRIGDPVRALPSCNKEKA